MDGEFVYTEAEKDQMAREAITGHQPSWDPEDEVADPDGQHPFEPHSPPAVRAGKSLKRLRDDFETERPDLARYFDEFGDFGPEVLDEERIKICRAYASYLAAIQAPKPKKKVLRKVTKK